MSLACIRFDLDSAALVEFTNESSMSFNEFGQFFSFRDVREIEHYTNID